MIILKIFYSSLAELTVTLECKGFRLMFRDRPTRRNGAANVFPTIFTLLPPVLGTDGRSERYKTCLFITLLCFIGVFLCVQSIIKKHTDFAGAVGQRGYTAPELRLKNN